MSLFLFFSQRPWMEKLGSSYISAGVHLGKAKGNWIWNWVRETRSGVQCGFWVFCRKADKWWLLETFLRSDVRWQLWLGGVTDSPWGAWAWAPLENAEVFVQHTPVRPEAAVAGIANLSQTWSEPHQSCRSSWSETQRCDWEKWYLK